MNYAETGSDSDDSNFGSEGEIDDVEEFEEEDAVNDDLEDDEQEEEEMDDEFYEDEVVEEEDKPKKARGKYKQPGVKVLRHTGKQLHVRLRFSDKYIYASLFSDTPTEQPVKEEEEEEDQEEDEDDEEDEVVEEEDKPKKARGKYKQPGVKVLRHTGKQLHVRLRFSDKYIYASLFSDTPTEQPVKEEEEEEDQEEDEDDEEDEVEEEGDMTPEVPKVPKSVMQLIYLSLIHI